MGAVMMIIMASRRGQYTYAALAIAQGLADSGRG